MLSERLTTPPYYNLLARSMHHQCEEQLFDALGWSMTAICMSQRNDDAPDSAPVWGRFPRPAPEVPF